MDLSNDRYYSMYDFIFINQLDWTCYHMIDLFGSISYFKKLLPPPFYTHNNIEVHGVCYTPNHFNNNLGMFYEMHGHNKS